MISEGSCETEDLSNDAENLSLQSQWVELDIQLLLSGC